MSHTESRMLLHHSFEEYRPPPARQDRAGLRRRAPYLRRHRSRASSALARLLRARGVRRGDRVALFLDNGIEMVVGVYAALRLGAVFMPVNPLTKEDKLAYLLNDCARERARHARGAARGIWRECPCWRQSLGAHLPMVASRRRARAAAARGCAARSGDRRGRARRRASPRRSTWTSRASSTPRARPATRRA